MEACSQSNRAKKSTRAIRQQYTQVGTPFHTIKGDIDLFQKTDQKCKTSGKVSTFRLQNEGVTQYISVW